MAEAELATIARPYARAAFGFALDNEGGLAKWSRMLALLSAAMEESVVRQAVDDPLASGDVEAQLLIDLLGEELDEHAANFLKILASYDRVSLLPEIGAAYEVLKANHEKTIEVDVISAFDVSDGEAATLKDALARKLQRDVNLHTEVDKSLLGGVIIRAEDNVFDNSVRGKLQKLAQALG